MRSPEDYLPVSLETRRIPLLRTVSLVSETDGRTLEGMGINISMTGMFVRTDDPYPVGSMASFSLTLAEGDEAIEGVAEVMWVRDEDAGHFQPPGMGTRFLKVSGEGRRKIRETVQRLVEETSAPSELRDLRLVVEKTLEDVFARTEEGHAPRPAAVAPPPVSQAEAGAAVAGSALESENRKRTWAVVAAFIALAVAAIFLLRRVPPAEVEVDSLPSPAAAPVSAPPAAPAAGLEDPEGLAEESVTAQEREERAAREAEEAVALAVGSWAAAWSSQDPAEYLDHYSPDFRPSGGSSRQAWAAERRQRLTAPRFIQVSIENLQVRLLDEDRAEAQFLQRYRSDTYQDAVRKALDFVYKDGRWRIVEEAGI